MKLLRLFQNVVIITILSLSIHSTLQAQNPCKCSDIAANINALMFTMTPNGTPGCFDISVNNQLPCDYQVSDFFFNAYLAGTVTPVTGASFTPSATSVASGTSATIGTICVTPPGRIVDFYLWGMDPNLCFVVAAHRVYYNQLARQSAYSEELEIAAELTALPNPAYTHVNFTFRTQASQSKIEIFDGMGGLIEGFTVNTIKGMNSVPYNTSLLPHGMYMVKVTTDGNRLIVPLIIQR